MDQFPRRAVCLLLAAYHRFMSPCLPRSCRFFPSCSVYTSEAIQKYGVLRGTALGFRRLGRCHPWSPGGFDPVR